MLGLFTIFVIFLVIIGFVCLHIGSAFLLEVYLLTWLLVAIIIVLVSIKDTMQKEKKKLKK